LEFDIEQGQLKSVAETALRMVSARGTHPVLGGIKMEVKGTVLRATATNLEQTVEVTEDLGSAAIKDGVVVVPGKLFAETIKSLRPGKVTLTAKEGEVAIKGGRSRFDLTCLTVEDFPEMADMAALGDVAAVTLESSVLAIGIKQVARAVSTDEVRPVLTGALWSIGNGELRLVATDSYRLALRTIPVPDTEDMEAIVPGAFLIELGRHLGKGPVTLRFGTSAVSAEVGAVKLTSRLIEGEFPKYRQLVPEGHPNKVQADCAAFKAAVGRVSVVAGSSTPVKIVLDASRLEAVTFKAVEAGVGEAEEVLEAGEGEYEGDPMTVAFNPRFLADGVDAIEGDRFVLEVASPVKPGLLRGLASEDGSFTYIAMPVRLSR
jgi:DNA polymerase-3 subunit beta